ncbi:MAG: hypothetical protein ABSG38_03800 [Spirochaetia bacterium]
MVSSAEAEANKRKAEARAEAQKRHSALLSEKAAEGERAVSAEKERAAKERREKNEEYRVKLSANRVDREGFFRKLTELIEKDAK